MRFLTVGANDSDQRLDRFLLKYLPKASQSYLQKMIRIKKIKVNKKRAESSQELHENDEVEIYIYDEELDRFKKDEYKKSTVRLNIVFENTDFAVIDKPKGILSHAAKPADYGKNIVDAFETRLIATGEYVPRMEQGFRPAIVNRLDFNTEGLIIGAKNHKAMVALNSAIAEGNVEKYYRAVCYGKIDNEIVIDKSIQINGKDKNAVTIVKPIFCGNDFTYVDIKLITGRFHQIRSHLSSIGHPLIGDTQYGNGKNRKDFINSQMLIAYKLKFKNIPNYSEWEGMEFKSDRIEKFEKLVKKLMEQEAT